MLIDGFKSFFIVVGAVMVGLIAGMAFLALVFGIWYQIEEWIDTRKEKKKNEANLRITVDQSWKEKMK